MTTRYYFIDSNINPDTIYGDQYPVCLPESEVKRLSAEYGVDLFEQMHEADADEIATYGVYDADKVPNFTAAVELMDDEIREEIHAEGTYTTEADFLAEYRRRHLEKYGEEFTF